MSDADVVQLHLKPLEARRWDSAMTDLMDFARSNGIHKPTAGTASTFRASAVHDVGDEPAIFGVFDAISYVVSPVTGVVDEVADGVLNASMDFVMTAADGFGEALAPPTVVEFDIPDDDDRSAVADHWRRSGPAAAAPGTAVARHWEAVATPQELWDQQQARNARGGSVEVEPAATIDALSGTILDRPVPAHASRVAPARDPALAPAPAPVRAAAPRAVGPQTAPTPHAPRPSQAAAAGGAAASKRKAHAAVREGLLTEAEVEIIRAKFVKAAGGDPEGELNRPNILMLLNWLCSQRDRPPKFSDKDLITAFDLADENKNELVRCKKLFFSYGLLHSLVVCFVLIP